ncbi:hypothetical protein A677_04508 [Salmonella enterica subsp. enterica serovar Enteritidis str. 2010K-0267]|nr:hypothetical protein A677_04508 [Salmonella enterica subsp. enterica serovar Enteritidis str. 2010K-0267]
MLIYHYDNVIFGRTAALERNGSSKQQRYTKSFRPPLVRDKNISH